MAIYDPVKRAAYMREYRAKNRARLRERNRLYEKRYAETHRVRIRENQRRHRVKNIEKYRAYNAEWHRKNRAGNPQKMRDRLLKNLYGWTQGMVDAAIVAQPGCGICHTDIPGGRTNQWHVDHNHDTGTVRGILCHACNTGGGLFKDSADLLRAAAEWFSKA